MYSDFPGVRTCLVAMLLAAASALTGCNDGKPSEVYIVNGTKHEYTVKLNGALYALSPLRPLMLKFPAGPIKVEFADGKHSPIEVTCEGGSNRRYVLNPDGKARLICDWLTYGNASPKGVEELQPQVFLDASDAKAMFTEASPQMGSGHAKHIKMHPSFSGAESF